MDRFSYSFNRLSIGRGRKRSHVKPSRNPVINILVPSLEYLCGEEDHFESVSKASTVKIPLIFRSIENYQSVMESNIKAEYYQSVLNSYHDITRGEGGWLKFLKYRNENKVVMFQLISQDESIETWSQNLVQIKDHSQLFLVTFCENNQMVLKGGGSMVIHGNLEIRSICYIGSFLLQLKETLKIVERKSHLLNMILDPSISSGSVSTYCMSGISDLVPCNEKQREAVLGLKPGLEVIQGPPGTGKSTTIWHIINSRLAPNSQCLITCSRNQAVNAAVEKVASFGVVVFGNPERLGEEARTFTLTALLMLMRRDRVANILSRWKKFDVSIHKRFDIQFPGLVRLKKASKVTTEGFNAASRWCFLLKSILFTNKLKKFNLYRKRNLWLSFCRGYEKLTSLIVPKVRMIRERYILGNSRVYCCTIDSTSNMVKTLSDKKVELNLDTCIVDEAGCVLESSIPILLKFHPTNIILIGDQNQLQPFSVVRDDNQYPKYHCRSLLERVVLNGANPWFLSEQYRMNEDVCSIVSSLYYGGALVTSQSLKRSGGVQWIQNDGAEIAHPRRGYSNPKEASIILDQVIFLLNTVKSDKIIYIITFYNKQKKEILDLMEQNQVYVTHQARVTVLSVDACQGSEADYVIVSTVRTKEVGGFMEDKRRLCVALSRAKYGTLLNN
ncbi:hypothetical protein HDV02_005470 [Globomyces sp. JEL0801]|nr:hypothetical protein HDV02_005470 [Globomyces sp. JEL0801]